MRASAHFKPVKLQGFNLAIDELNESNCPENVLEKKENFLSGEVVLRGIPFLLGAGSGKDFAFSDGQDIKLSCDNVKAKHLVFAHASDIPIKPADEDGIYRDFKGYPPLNEKVCDYVIYYADGSKETIPIRNRMEINHFTHGWGEGAFNAQPHERFRAINTVTDDLILGNTPAAGWGISQTRVKADYKSIMLQMYAWENPYPEKEIIAIEINHRSGRVYLMGVTAGNVNGHPLIYGRRQKTVLTIDSDEKDPLKLVDIDLGQIISVLKRPVYNHENWEQGHNNQQPVLSDNEYIVEFCAHEDAVLYICAHSADTKNSAGTNNALERGGTSESEMKPLPVKDLPKYETVKILAAEQPVTLKVLGPEGKPVPVKVHAHGIGGEYLPPRHRHRIPNPYWFEDYSVDYLHGPHWCTYIDGTAEYLLPQGEVFFEVSKGFEIKPMRCRFEITPDTSEIEIKLEKVLDWRSHGWVTADTHVHFLSPHSALLEGEAEGVNVVNLLASQWGELFTNIGDFDGKAVAVSRDDYFVNVGTENRQHLLGHISLLGYEGGMILPLTTDGPDEAAIGDPVEFTLTQWAKQCREQNGIVVLPHFPGPRAEHASAIVSELIDGVEMTSWGDLYSGISPYSLSDWYRYLNCGYHIAAVGGTDKMSASTAVGTIRTYAKVDGLFTFDAWRDALRAGRTFATYGALVDFCVDGKLPGESINLNGKATLQIDWKVASATIPITAIELVVGGDTWDVKRFDNILGNRDGSFSINVDKSTWVALRVRGHHPEKPEIIIAHTSAVMVIVDGKRPMKESDAMSILEQIEGSTVYIKTLGTRAQEVSFKKALDALTSAHRALHNRMHEMGYYHNHNVVDDHHKD